MAREILSGHRPIAIFLHINIAIPYETDFDEVVEFPRFARCLETHWAEIKVFDLFGSGEARDVLDEFLYSVASRFHYVAVQPVVESRSTFSSSTSGGAQLVSVTGVISGNGERSVLAISVAPKAFGSCNLCIASRYCWATGACRL